MSDKDKLGRKFDQEKGRWDLMPFEPLEEVVEILTYGAIKYAPNNWKYVKNSLERYTAAAFRHLSAWRRNEPIDPETGKRHLAHALCNLIIVMEIERINNLKKGKQK